MSRCFARLAAAGFACAAGPSFAADCAATLAGEWVTQGNVNAGFIKVKVDNRDSYDADGSFKAVRRFLNLEGKWETQTASGKWSAKPGDNADQCVIERLSTGAFGSMSSSSTVTIVDKDTFRSFGLEAKRAE